TKLIDLDDNLIDYATGDSIRILGTTAAGATVDTSLAVDNATTLADVVAALNTNFPDATAALTADGNIVVQGNATGPSLLSVNIADAAGNTGATIWGNHTEAITTA